jgi:hypothetical protein
MTRKRNRQTAFLWLAALGGVVGLLPAPQMARGDVVTEISTLSQANRLSIFHDYSIDALGQTVGTGPGPSGSGELNPLLGSYATSEALDSERSYALSVTPIAGYDSNPEARRIGQGSLFGGADLGALYRIDLGPDDATVGSPTQFRFDYDLTGAVYDGTVPNADVLQQTVSGSYRRSLFHDSLYFNFGLKDQLTLEHGEAFLNTLDASPGLEWFLAPQISAEVNYDYARMGYFIRVAAPRDPDANRNTVNTKLHFYSFPQQRGPVPESPDQLGDILRAALNRATIGYAFVDNEATGRDYEYNANRLSLGVEGVHIPRFRSISLDVDYAHEWVNYMNPSTEGPIIIAGSPKQRRRKDHEDIFTLRANDRLIDLSQDRGSVSTFLQWDLIADRSNIEARHFNEFVISGGLEYRY